MTAEWLMLTVGQQSLGVAAQESKLVFTEWHWTKETLPSPRQFWTVRSF